MRKKFIPLSLALCLTLSGCGGNVVLERSYSVSTPHSEVYWENEGADTLRADSYQDLVNALLLLLGEHSEEGVVRIYSEEDAAAMAEQACKEVQEETALGAYLLDYISYTDTQERAYYEMHVRLGYRRTAEAVSKGEFEPYFQFVVDRGGTIIGAETVSRWQNPEEGLLKPSKYIDLMIRAGTITELDLYMLRCACVQLQTWKREGRGTLWLSCNFTRQSIADEKILARVREIVEQYDFTRDRLAVELTEDSYAHDRETALRTIEGLHAMGLRIVLDDIGAGYSSLSDLSTYPIDGVKIDRSIVIESALPRARALLEGMIRLSHDMGIRVLCEGVEDKATCDAVLAAGCDFIQGFYFSRVLPGREAESFLRSLAARDRGEG